MGDWIEKLEFGRLETEFVVKISMSLRSKAEKKQSRSQKLFEF
jgi:hypothetical protein